MTRSDGLSFTLRYSQVSLYVNPKLPTEIVSSEFLLNVNDLN